MRKFRINEYEVIEDLSNNVFKALRNDQEWKDLVGDNFTLSLVEKIDSLYNQLSTAENLLSDAHNLLDDIHGYDTETYRDISRYFDGDNEE